MSIVKITDINNNEWNRFCQQSDDAWLFHRSEWIFLEEKFSQVNNKSFAVITNDKLQAIVPLYLFYQGLGAWEEKLLSTGFPRHAGIAFKNGLPISQQQLIQREIMHYIFRIATMEDVDRIQIAEQNLAPNHLLSSRRKLPFWLVDDKFYAGLHLAGHGILPAPGFSTTHADQIINLTRNFEMLYQALEPTCKRAIKKAERSGLNFYVADHKKEISKYYNLALLSAKRTGEQLLAYEYYTSLSEIFLSNNLLLFFILKDGQVIAGLLLAVYKNAASYLGGVSHPDYLNCRINDYIHWKAINYAKEIGLQYYRLGPIFPTLAKESAIAKVSRFKKKFGGESYDIIQGSYYRYPEKYYPAIFKFLEDLQPTLEQ